MEKLSRMGPVLALIAVLILAILFLFSNNRLHEAVERLEAAESKIDSTLFTLSLAKSALDSVRGDLMRFGTYVHDIQARVEILDLSRRADDERFRNQKATIAGRLKILYRDIEMTGKELPEIPIVERRN